jgi:hypothetical protein
MTSTEIIETVRALRAKYGETPTQVTVNSKDWNTLRESCPAHYAAAPFESFNVFLGLRVILDDSVTTPQFK